MSAMSTFAVSRDLPLSGILNNIHQTMRKRMEDQYKNNQLKDKAKVIESFLRQLKKEPYTFKKNRNKYRIITDVRNDFSDILIDAQNELLQQNSALGGTRLFRRSHNKFLGKTNLKADDVFEEEFASLITSLMKKKKMLDKDISTSVMLIGGQSATTEAVEDLSQEAKDKLIKLTNEAIAEQSRRLGKEVTQTKYIKEIVAATGKIDVSVPMSIEIVENGDDLIDNFLRAIQGMNFSLKNYRSKTFTKNEKTGKYNYKGQRTEGEISLHLGDSNLPKAVMGALSPYLSVKDQENVYYRGITILSGRSKEPDTASYKEINEHFAHLRFIYELRGQGLLANGSNQMVDFIIWNDPDSENIAVESTLAIILDRWEQYSSLYGRVSLAVSALMSQN